MSAPLNCRAEDFCPFLGSSKRETPRDKPVASASVGFISLLVRTNQTRARVFVVFFVGTKVYQRVGVQELEKTSLVGDGSRSCFVAFLQFLAVQESDR
jgi:hypothetical protein